MVVVVPVFVVIVTVGYLWFCKVRLVKLVRLDKLAWLN